MKSIGNALLQIHDKKSAFERAVLNLLFSAAGRGGEIGLLSWNSASWDEQEQALVFKWSEPKTGNQFVLPIYCDAESMFACPIHALACYFVLGGGNSHLNSINIDDQFVFGQLAKLAQTDNGCSASVTAMLRNLVHPSKYPNPKSSSSSSR